MAVDWEQRVDFDRMRAYRAERIRQTLDTHDLGAVLLFETSNIRSTTGTHIALVKPGVTTDQTCSSATASASACMSAPSSAG